MWSTSESRYHWPTIQDEVAILVHSRGRPLDSTFKVIDLVGGQGAPYKQAYNY